MTGQAHLAYAVGAAVALGGLAGFVRQKSVPSLIAGVTFGAGFAYCGSAISSGRFLEGHAGASALGGLLALSMGYRAVKTGKVMPAGAVAGLGAASCAYHTKKALEWL